MGRPGHEYHCTSVPAATSSDRRAQTKSAEQHDGGRLGDQRQVRCGGQERAVVGIESQAWQDAAEVDVAGGPVAVDRSVDHQRREQGAAILRVPQIVRVELVVIGVLPGIADRCDQGQVAPQRRR